MTTLADIESADFRAVLTEMGQSVDWDGTTVTAIVRDKSAPDDRYPTDNVRRMEVRLHVDDTDRPKNGRSLEVDGVRSQVTAVAIHGACMVVDLEQFES